MATKISRRKLTRALQRAIIAAMKTQATSADRSSWRNGPRKSDTITAQMSSAHTVQREMAQLMSRARRESTASSDRMSGADSSPALESPASTDRPRGTARVFLIGGNWKDCVWTAVAQYVAKASLTFRKPGWTGCSRGLWSRDRC